MSALEAAARHMTRLQAEQLIASAYRIPSGDAWGSERREEATKTGDAAASTDRGGTNRLRGMTRLPSRTLLMSPNELYLQQTGAQFYVDDLVRQLQDSRPEQPGQFIASYFNAVAKGTNVKGRSFEYINGCLQNRAAFLAQLQRSYAKVDLNTPLSVGDFTELLWCQCRDLPPQLVQQATCHLSEGEDGERRAPLRALVAAFSACFFFNEFLSKVFDIYSETQASKDGGRIGSPCSNSRSESVANAVAADRVIARLRVVTQQNTFSIPPITEVEQIAAKSGSFKEFCRLFYESPALAACVQDLQLAFQTLAALTSSPPATK